MIAIVVVGFDKHIKYEFYLFIKIFETPLLSFPLWPAPG